MTQTNLTVPSVVLVHAAWADASSWNKVITPLQRKGMQVVAVQIPLTSLSDDAATVRKNPQEGKRAGGAGGPLLWGLGHHGCG